LNLRPDVLAFMQFADKTTAAAFVPYGKGKVIAYGFMPGLAYGQGAHFAPRELKEHWRDDQRFPLQSALNITPIVTTNTPVVEASVLQGPAGVALILANYTYQPIDNLHVKINLNDLPTHALSTEGAAVRIDKTEQGIELQLPLKWTDIVILK
jgi:hypothetical protein